MTDKEQETQVKLASWTERFEAIMIDIMRDRIDGDYYIGADIGTVVSEFKTFIKEQGNARREAQGL